MIDYIPTDLTRKQARLIIRLNEPYGIGCSFAAARANTTHTECAALVKLGYMDRSSGVNCYYYRLTEKCQPFLTANN